MSMATEQVAKQGEKGAVRREVARDPFLALRERMDRLIDEFTGGYGAWPFSWDIRSMEWRTGAFMPSVDIKDKENEIRIEAELPGVSEKDVELSLSGDSLIIRGEKKHATEEKEKGYYRAERSYGSFERSIPLPVDVDRDKVEATFKNGVLNITLPKTKEAIQQTKKIPIHT
jgi:HSP20 family protein